MLNIEGISSQDSAFNGEILMQPSQFSAEHSSSMNEPQFVIGGMPLPLLPGMNNLQR
jgi:hypothetical protein